MHGIILAFQRGLRLVNENLTILVVALVFTVFPEIYTRFEVNLGLRLFMVLLSLGWLGTKYLLLSKAYEKKELDWKDLWKNLFIYTKKLIPAITILAILGSIPVLISGLFFTRWFMGEYFQESSGLIEGNWLDQVSLAIGNPILWSEFVSQSVMFQLMTLVFAFLGVAGLLVVKVFLSILVTEEEGLWKTLTRVGKFLSKHWLLLVVYFVLRGIIELMSLLVEWISLMVRLGSMSLAEVLGQIPAVEAGLWSVFVILVVTYVSLVIDAAVLIYYCDNRDGSRLVRKIKQVVRHKS